MLFNEPKLLKFRRTCSQTGNINLCFSALQRAEIAEIRTRLTRFSFPAQVSVLFNEPKLLKLVLTNRGVCGIVCFSALQRAEIAEIA